LRRDIFETNSCFVFLIHENKSSQIRSINEIFSLCKIWRLYIIIVYRNRNTVEIWVGGISLNRDFIMSNSTGYLNSKTWKVWSSLSL
jgi:hypothetical protein